MFFFLRRGTAVHEQEFGAVQADAVGSDLYSLGCALRVHDVGGKFDREAVQRARWQADQAGQLAQGSTATGYFLLRHCQAFVGHAHFYQPPCAVNQQ